MNQLTVIITTYNLEKYIKEALISVCEQKTTFPFDILVADDASTDNTVGIIRSIQEQYLGRIRLLCSDQNMGSLANSNRALSEVKTEYFTFLDGDDYWIDNCFLQKRVDFLKENPDFMMCGSNTYYIRDGKVEIGVIQDKQCGKAYSFQDYLQGKIPFVHTSSIVLRNAVFTKGLPAEYSEAVGEYYECALRGEDYRFLIHLLKGKIYVLQEYASCYRIHPQGIWQGSSEIKHQLEGAIAAFYYMNKWKTEFPVVFEKRFLSAYRRLMICLKENRIEQQYFLSYKDTLLLAALLTEVSRTDIHWAWEEDKISVRERMKAFIKHVLKK